MKNSRVTIQSQQTQSAEGLGYCRYPSDSTEIRNDYVWDKLRMEKADVIVEIGAGTAFFSIAFLQQTKHSKIYACDVSEVMINWVKENVVQKFPNIIPVKPEHQ